MKAKLLVRRYPFISFTYNFDYAFMFYPKIFENNLTTEQEIEFQKFLATIIPKISELQQAYEMLKQKFNVKYIEVNETIEITESQLEKIIEYAKTNNLELKPYVEILPKITEQEFEVIRKIAEKKGYQKAIKEVLG